MNCKHKNTYIDHNVGSDIWDGGEEKQHIEHCKDCAAYRFRVEGICWKDYEGNDQETTPFYDIGPWNKKDSAKELLV